MPIEAAMQDDDRDALAAEYVLGTLSLEERGQAEALLARNAGFAETVRLWEHRLGELNVMVEAVEPPPDVWERIKTGIDGAERRSAAAAQTIELNGEPSERVDAAEASLGLTAPDASIDPDIHSVQDLLAEREQNLESPTSRDRASTPLAADTAGEFEDRPPRSTAGQTGIITDVPVAGRNIGPWRTVAIGASLVAALLAIYIGIAQFAPGLIGRHSQLTAAAPKAASIPQLVAVLQQEPTLPAFLV